MAEAPANLGARTASGTMWMASQTIISRATSLLSQLLLARLLMPSEFGQIGLVYTITSFATQLTNPGVDDVLLQKQKHLGRWITAAFWMTITCSIAGAALMMLIAVAVVQFAQAHGNAAYGDPTLVRMVAILAASAPLSSAILVPWVVLRAEMRFARVATLGFGDIVLQQFLTVFFAAWGFGAYSFVLPIPITAAIRLTILWVMVKPPIKFHLSLHRWPSLTSSAGWVFGQRMLYTATSQGDYIILAALYADKAMVGSYFFAFMLSTQVIRLLCDNAGATLTPALNAIRDDASRMWQAVNRSARALASLVVPIVTLQILLAGPIIRLLFATKWAAAIPLVRWLSAGSLLYWALWPMAAAMAATGRFRENCIAWAIGAISFFAFVAPGTYVGGAIGTAASVAAWSWFMVICYALITYRSIDGLVHILRAGWVSWLGALAGTLPSLLAIWLLPPTPMFDLLSIAIVTTLVLAAYTATMRRLDRDAMEELLRHSPGPLRPVARIFLGQAAI